MFWSNAQIKIRSANSEEGFVIINLYKHILQISLFMIKPRIY